MRKIWVMTAALAVLTAAACDGEVDARTTRGDGEGVSISAQTVRSDDSRMRVASRLDCPEREGGLRLASAAADGRSCLYRTRNGEAEVQLQLAALTGPADARLQALEADLKQLVPAAAAAAARPPVPPVPPPPPSPPTPGDDGLSVTSDDERAQVRLPGVRIDAEGERASVSLPGVRINANGDKADVQVNGDDGEAVSVRANEGGAEIRTAEKTRAAGDIRSTYLLASETPGPAGWRVAGYRAHGPGAGPLVIGVIRARGKNDDDLMDDVEDLVDRNVDR